MSEYQMTCSCGDEIKVDAADRDEAVSKIQAMMTDEAVAAHMKEKHPGEPVPPTAQIHGMILANTVPA